MIRCLAILISLASPLLGFTPDDFADSAKLNGTVYDVAQQSDGGVIAVGSFTKAGSTSRIRIARYLLDGSLDASFSPGSGANAAIHQVAITEDDEIVIGGDFTTYQGNDASHAAVLYPDGSFKRALHLPASTVAVHAIEVAQGSAYIGGDFTGYFLPFNLLGGYSRPKPSGSPNGPVRAICVEDVSSGPFITLGGDFTRIGSTNVGYIAHLDRESRLLAASTANSGANGPVTALDLTPGDTIQSRAIISVGGDFTQFNGQWRNRLAALTTPNPGFSFPVPGSLYGGLGSQFTPNISGSIHAIKSQKYGLVAIGGEFTVPTDTHVNLVFASHSGGLGNGTQSDHQPNGPVHALYEQTDGMLLIGGEFTTIDGLSRSRLTRLYGAGGDDPPNAPSMDIVYPLDEDSIYVSWEPSSSSFLNHYAIERQIPNGSWELAGTVTSDRLRFFDSGLKSNTSYNYRVLTVSGTGSGASATGNTYTKSPPVGGTAEETFDSSVNPYASIRPVNRISVDAQQRVLAAESSKAPLTESYQLHRLLPDGSLDETFSASFRWGIIQALEALPDGKIMIGGEFLSVNEQPKNYLARLLDDGSLDPAFAPKLDAQVNAILPLADGSYLIAGTFTTVNGVSREKIARLHSDGRLDGSFEFASEGFAINSITDLQQSTGGSIYFSASIVPDSGGAAKTTIFKVDDSGLADPEFSLPADLEISFLSSFRLGPTGKLYLAGKLWPNPKPADFLDARIVRLLSNGSIDTTFSSDGYGPAFEKIYSSRSTTPAITALIIPADEKAITSGDFNFFDGRPRFGIARHSATGRLDHSYVGGTGPQAISSWHEEGFYQLPIYDFASLPNGTVVAGGTFSGINGVERKCVATLHSGPYTGTPAKPATPTVTPRGNQLLFVNWTPLANATGYAIERQLSGESAYTEVARVPSGWRHYVDSLSHGTTASYRIRSIIGTSLSSVSSSATATATSPYGSWLESHELPADTDPDSDDDLDQLPLLVEYALQRDPMVFDDQPWFRTLNSESISVDTPRPDLSYTIQSSTDLNEWADDATAVGGPDTSLSLPLAPESEPKRYFRLEVLPL